MDLGGGEGKRIIKTFPIPIPNPSQGFGPKGSLLPFPSQLISEDLNRNKDFELCRPRAHVTLYCVALYCISCYYHLPHSFRFDFWKP
jgi:hypothetical protein